MKRRTGRDTCCNTCLLNGKCPRGAHCGGDGIECYDSHGKLYCLVCRSYKPKQPDGQVPDWLKKVAKEMKGKTITLKQMRKRLSKCKTSLSDEIIKERDED